MTAVLHIASLLVQHQPEAAQALDGLLASLPGAELALRECSRSVVLCEGPDEAGLLAAMDAMAALPGVVGVSLVHHHAEPLHELLKEIDHDHAP